MILCPRAIPPGFPEAEASCGAGDLCRRRFSVWKQRAPPAAKTASATILRDFPQRRPETAPPRYRHAQQIGRRHRQLLAHGPSEILIQRIERVRLQFPENPPQRLLNPVDRMKESAPVHF